MKSPNLVPEICKQSPKKCHVVVSSETRSCRTVSMILSFLFRKKTPTYSQETKVEESRHLPFSVNCTTFKHGGVSLPVILR